MIIELYIWAEKNFSLALSSVATQVSVSCEVKP